MARYSSLTGPLLALTLALLLGGLSGCSEPEPPIRNVTVHADTPVERKETIGELRDAWHARVRLAGTKRRHAELRFLIRLASAVNRFQDTESYGDICALWNQCLGDHLSYFPESGR